MDKMNILIKYGELTLKKKNTQNFKNMLLRNVRSALSEVNCEVSLAYSRMYVEFESEDFLQVQEILSSVYGIHSFAPYVACENDIDVIKKTAYECVKDLEYETFKVETKRKNKRFELSSIEISRTVGGYINYYSNLSVDIHSPDVTVFLEVRNKETLIYYDEYKGLGGLPVGSSGKSLLMLSGGIDSPVAGHLINKRGVRYDAIHFTSPPYTAKESVDKIHDLCEKLQVYNGDFNLYIVSFTKVQEELLQMRQISYFMTIMRRVMYLIANKIALDNDYKAIINGDAIGQVASQTLESMAAIDSVVDLPVIRPLAVFDKLEVIKIAKKIATYDISIRPFEDCCTVFVPDNPVIKPKMTEVAKIENHFNFEEMIEKCIESIEVVKVTTENKEFSTLL